VAPPWAVALDQRPKALRVVRDVQMAELVHDDVVEHLGGREHEAPVEGERAAPRAGAPERALVPDPDSSARDADARRLLFDDGREDLARSDARLGLAHAETLEAEPRNLAPPLMLDPGAPLGEHP